MHGFIILAIIGTEQDTLVFYLTQMLTDGWTDGRTDGQTDRKLNSFIAPCYKQVL